VRRAGSRDSSTCSWGHEAEHVNLFEQTLFPFAGILANVLGHVAISRLPLPRGPVRRQFVSFAIGLAIVIYLSFVRRPIPDAGPAQAIPGILLSCLSYSFYGFVFFNALNANVSSLRVRLIRELAHAGPDGIATHELRTRYGREHILQVRLERLLTGGQLYLRDGRYHLKRGGVWWIGRLFALLRQVLLRTDP
jgi:hypothetical protein